MQVQDKTNKSDCQQWIIDAKHQNSKFIKAFGSGYIYKSRINKELQQNKLTGMNLAF